MLMRMIMRRRRTTSRRYVVVKGNSMLLTAYTTGYVYHDLTARMRAGEMKPATLSTCLPLASLGSTQWSEGNIAGGNHAREQQEFASNLIILDLARETKRATKKAALRPSCHERRLVSSAGRSMTRARSGVAAQGGGQFTW